MVRRQSEPRFSSACLPDSHLTETFHLVLKLINPLAAPLAIGGLELVTDATDSSVDIQAPQELELGPREIKEVSRDYLRLMK